MNWFLYVGGYIIFWVVSAVFDPFAYVLKSNCSDMAKNYSVILHTIASLFIWIWICWKFVN